VPRFQHDDIDRVSAATVAMLGPDAFVAAFERGRRGELGNEVAFPA
jgi:hypothetical protein